VLRFFLVCGCCFVVRRLLMPLTSSSSRRRGSILGSGVAGEHAHRDGTRRSRGAYLRGPRHPREGGDPSWAAVWQEITLIEVELDDPRGARPGGAEFHLGHRCARGARSSRWNSTVPPPPVILAKAGIHLALEIAGLSIGCTGGGALVILSGTRLQEGQPCQESNKRSS